MKKELEKTYQPQTVEREIYQRWERSGFFNPDKLPGKRTKTFSIAMPPPNVTGELHLGHATAITIEDLLTRYHRMRGDKTLYLPGTDHAGIATQIVVERLIRDEGLDRHKLGRNKFIKRVWSWKKKYGSRITTQIRQLGASCDWSRERFTMDPQLTQAVQKAFLKLHQDSLIYRGDRIINWCPRCASALSDLEVKHQTGPGKLWYIRYPIFGSTKYLVVATTRPETMLGDTAVAVNPSDSRYKKLLKNKIILPLVNREIPIIIDAQVDKNFGTGAVKVTPAHDHLDYDIGLRHNLPIINVIGQDGKMTKEAGAYYGKSVSEARHLVIDKLNEEGLLEKTEDYQVNLARCDRCSTPIEFLVSKQWFIKIKPLAKLAINAVKTKKIEIYPRRYEKTFFHWMENIRDWCISRQLWWGHQLPVWYQDNKIKVSATKPGSGWQQDQDTLDTWFSSGLWTFSTLGWPKKTIDLKNFHPTSVMETGWDILFFWVARMIMLSLYFTKQVPFKKVYLHGLVLDREGHKMSKSKGTGVDPIPMTEKYGTDAIRLSLVLGTTAGQDFRLYEEKIAGYRNFVNKLWNVSRFILSQVPETKSQPHSLADAWILSRLNKLIRDVTSNIESLKFSDAGTAIYEFLWHEFADWYLEISKTHKNYKILTTVLDTVLKLLHPFIPFVTEAIWSALYGSAKKEALIIQNWPKPKQGEISEQAEKNFEYLKKLIINWRNFAAEHKIIPPKKISVKFWGGAEELVQNNKDLLVSLAKLETLTLEKGKSISGSLNGLDYEINYQADEMLIKKKREEISAYIQTLQAKLNNPNFIKNAPPKIIEETKKKLSDQQATLNKLLSN